MLQFLSKTIGLFWGDSNNVPINSPDVKETYRTSPDKLTEVPVICRSLYGKITDLCSGYGLIDGHIYFKFDTVVGSIRPQVGQLVHATITGTNQEGGWTANKVYVQTENWECDDGENGPSKDGVNHNLQTIFNVYKSESNSVNDQKEELKEESIIGVISDIQGMTVTLNNEIPLKMVAGACEFSFIKGDWVSVNVRKHNENGNEISQIVSMKPLRKRKLQGNISFLRLNFGIVDRQVYFQQNIISNNYVPRMHDSVVVVAIESDQGRLHWRALSIVPTSVTLQERKQDNKVFSQKPLLFRNVNIENNCKEGISISSPDFGVIGQNETKTSIVIVKNTSDKNHVLEGIKIEPTQNNQFLCSFHPFSPSVALDLNYTLQPHTTLSVKVHCTGRFLGRASKLIIFTFRGFQLGCHATVDVRLAKESMMKGNHPYKPREYQSEQLISNSQQNQYLMPGPKPFKTCHRLPIALPQYKVPIELRKCIENHGEILQVLPSLSEPLSLENYSIKLHELLYLEEIEKEKEFHNYKLTQICLNRRGEFLTLQLSNKDEDRPSVLVGDRVIVTYSSDAINAPQYEGFIHEILGDEFLLKFHPCLHTNYAKEPVNVSFHLNRTSLRRAHQAVELAPRLSKEILFPKSIVTKIPLTSFFERPLTCLHCKKKENVHESTPNNVAADKKSDCLKNGDVKSEMNSYVLVSPSTPLSGKKRRRKSVIERLFQLSFTDENQAKLQTTYDQKDGDFKQTSQESNGIYSTPNTSLERVASGYKNSVKEQVQPVNTSPFSKKTNCNWNKIWKIENSTIRTCKCVCHKTVTVDEGKKDQKILEWKHLLNKRQKTAVRHILKGIARPLPYVIYGPPGTGKTLTIVEAILQILRFCPESRILVCCPSNSAADIITERLHQSGEVDKNTMVRLNAYHRIASSIPVNVLNYSHSIENISLMVRHKLIICTCVTAGNFLSIGLHQGHFSHIFIDEAGQVTEPECLIPMLFAGPDTQIVLAGDPQQLGPTLRSPLVIICGLQMSFLERIMGRHLYQKNINQFSDHGHYDPLLITKLVNNYRSHPALIDLPSALFYESDLVACADVEMRNRFCNWEHLPRKGFPIFFHGLRGEECREGSSPSFFNPPEVMQVLQYVQTLYHNDVKVEDIGVITPYRKQVEKLKMMFTSLGIDEPKMGSVEEFQGNEKPVIIISTVRSCNNHIQTESKVNIGFLKNYRRFNVSITRSQSLLIIIGDPYVLSKDFHWNALLKYCVNSGSYVGFDIDLESSLL